MPIHSVRMPVIFISHGAGPCFFMDWNPAEAWTRMADFLKELSVTLPQRPSAIVLVSAHWLAPAFNVTGAAELTLIVDYSGFPSHTYALNYPAPGQPALAQRITDLLTQAQLTAQVDPVRGFDHGVFIPLGIVTPRAPSLLPRHHAVNHFRGIPGRWQRRLRLASRQIRRPHSMTPLSRVAMFRYRLQRGCKRTSLFFFRGQNFRDEFSFFDFARR